MLKSTRRNGFYLFLSIVEGNVFLDETSGLLKIVDDE